ncbi:hypothetical protein ABZ769_33840 [Streptomyces olivoreticuli]
MAVTQAANRASRRLLEAVGMQWTGAVIEYGQPQAIYRSFSQTPVLGENASRGTASSGT